MDDFTRRQTESASDWLARLDGLDPSALAAADREGLSARLADAWQQADRRRASPGPFAQAAGEADADYLRRLEAVDRGRLRGAEALLLDACLALARCQFELARREAELRHLRGEAPPQGH